MTVRPVRWWPAAVILALAAAGLALNALRDGQRQDKVMAAIMLMIVGAGAMLGWALLMSRLPSKVRLGIAAGTVVVALALVATVEIRGVYGDIVPILGWRWAARPAAPAGAPRIQPAEQVAPAPRGAADWSQFLGPARHPAVPDIALARDWSAQPPREVWRRQVGRGWSGFAVHGPHAVTHEQRGEDEAVICYELATGRPLWSHTDSAQFVDQTGGTISGIGPRATPTIEGDRVYAMGASGLLNCLDLATGQQRWVRDTMKDNGAQPLEWGMAGSPLIVDETVIVNVGGRPARSLVAYHKMTGEPVWAAGDDRASYSSPLLATVAGVRQVIVLNHNSVTGHDPADGRVLWRADWPGGHPKVAQPIVLGEDRLLVSSGYGAGCAVFQVSPDPAGDFRVEQLWKNLNMKAKFSNMIRHEGTIYGLDDGVLVALDPMTGRRRWKSGRYGHGQMILAGNLILVQSEAGHLALVEADPLSHVELARIRLFDHKTWNTPALAGRYLLVRTDQQAACYELPVK